MNLLVIDNSVTDVTEREVPPGLGGCEFELRLAEHRRPLNFGRDEHLRVHHRSLLVNL
jgi:hypothetical protein